MATKETFDSQVGRIAGCIYSDICGLFPQHPLMLVPPLTYKIRKVLGDAGDVSRLSDDGKRTVAEEIRVSIVPLLFSLEVDPAIIEKAVPIVELAAFKALLGRQPDGGS